MDCTTGCSLALAAGVMVVVLAGCASPASAPPPQTPELTWSELLGETPDARGTIAGLVRDDHGQPIEHALVILQSTALPNQIERMTNAAGVYAFGELPPGTYTIQVLAGKANVSKITALPEGAKFRANFTLNPQRGNEIIVGMVVCDGDRVIDPTTASSTYNAKIMQIP